MPSGGYLRADEREKHMYKIDSSTISSEFFNITLMNCLITIPEIVSRFYVPIIWLNAITNITISNFTLFNSSQFSGIYVTLATYLEISDVIVEGQFLLNLDHYTIYASPIPLWTLFKNIKVSSVNTSYGLIVIESFYLNNKAAIFSILNFYVFKVNILPFGSLEMSSSLIIYSRTSLKIFIENCKFYNLTNFDLGIKQKSTSAINIEALISEVTIFKSLFSFCYSAKESSLLYLSSTDILSQPNLPSERE